MSLSLFLEFNNLEVDHELACAGGVGEAARNGNGRGVEKTHLREDN